MRKWLKGSALALLIVATWLVLPGHAQDTNTLLTQWLTQLRAGTYTIGALATGTKLTNASDGVLTLSNNAGNDFTRLQFGGTTNAFPAIQRNASEFILKTADGAGNTNLTLAYLTSTTPAPTIPVATGITQNNRGLVIRTLTKVTVASTAFVCAALTCDVTIATLSAHTVLASVYADLTAVFACTATCTSAQLTGAGLGSSAGGTQYLATAMDLHTATKQFGLLDADMGSLLTRAAGIQGGAMSWAGNIVSFRLASGVGNIGTGAATNLSTGSITFYLVTEGLP